jgi:Arc/MetJ-type ribon-helix-helix transcriptional regulator
MRTASKQHERITISLPPGYSKEIKKLAADLDLSQSDVIVKALDAYRESRKKKKVEEMARSLVEEYRQNSELVALTSLDGEDFR